MEKILIVDDSPTQAAQLKSILDMDYDVTVAQTATEGLSHASSGKNLLWSFRTWLCRGWMALRC